MIPGLLLSSQEGSDLHPIDPVKLIALLDRLIEYHADAKQAPLPENINEAFRSAGAEKALKELKKDIVEHHHDLGATE